MEANRAITKAIYSVGNNSIIGRLAMYGGLVPYELYVIPGMYLAMYQMIWTGDINPVRFHLLPHFFAYSLVTFMKDYFGRERPGCVIQNMKNMIEPSHCEGKIRFRSFPSGHTMIASALAAALVAELYSHENPRLFTIPIPLHLRPIIASVGFVVTFLVSLHRIVGGYHYFGDVLLGGLIGSMIGFLCYNVLSDNNVAYITEFPIPLWGQILLSIPITLLFVKFIAKDLWRLTSIKH